MTVPPSSTLDEVRTGFTGLRHKIARTLDVWRQRIEMRRELAELTHRDIMDIGLDSAEIDREVAKPFWRE